MFEEHDKLVDLRLLYQAYSSQIEFSKGQLWRVVNYGIWALAGIVGFSKGFFNMYHHFVRQMSLFPVAVIIVCFICLYNMLKNWRSMITGRQKFDEISRQLSVTFRKTIKSPGRSVCRPFPRNYKRWTYDAWIVLPLMLFVICGSILAYVYLIYSYDMELVFGRSIQDYWLFGTSVASFVICSALFACSWLYPHSKRLRYCFRKFAGGARKPTRRVDQ